MRRMTKRKCVICVLRRRRLRSRRTTAQACEVRRGAAVSIIFPPATTTAPYRATAAHRKTLLISRAPPFHSAVMRCRLTATRETRTNHSSPSPATCHDLAEPSLDGYHLSPHIAQVLLCCRLIHVGAHAGSNHSGSISIPACRPADQVPPDPSILIQPYYTVGDLFIAHPSLLILALHYIPSTSTVILSENS